MWLGRAEIAKPRHRRHGSADQIGGIVVVGFARAILIATKKYKTQAWGGVCTPLAISLLGLMVAFCAFYSSSFDRGSGPHSSDSTQRVVGRRMMGGANPSILTMRVNAGGA